MSAYAKAEAAYNAAVNAPLSRRGVDTLNRISRLADQFKAGEIDALAFVVRVGTLLSELERAS